MYGLFEGKKFSGIKFSFFLHSRATVSQAQYAGAPSCWNAFKWH